MSAFKDQLTSDLDVFFNTDEFAEAVTYTPSGGSAVSISAIVDRADGSRREGGLSSLQYEAMIQVKASDLVARPKYRDKVTIDGIDYVVMEQGVTGDGYVWTVPLRAKETVK